MSHADKKQESRDALAKLLDELSGSATAASIADSLRRIAAKLDEAPAKAPPKIIYR